MSKLRKLEILKNNDIDSVIVMANSDVVITGYRVIDDDTVSSVGESLSFAQNTEFICDGLDDSDIHLSTTDFKYELLVPISNDSLISKLDFVLLSQLMIKEDERLPQEDKKSGIRVNPPEVRCASYYFFFHLFHNAADASSFRDWIKSNYKKQSRLSLVNLLEFEQMVNESGVGCNTLTSFIKNEIKKYKKNMNDISFWRNNPTVYVNVRAN